MNNKSTSMESTKIASLYFKIFFLGGYLVGEWKIGSRKKTQRLREHTVHLEGLHSVSNIHILWLTTTSNSNSKGIETQEKERLAFLAFLVFY